MHFEVLGCYHFVFKKYWPKVVFCRMPFPTKNRQCKTHLGPLEEYESVLEMNRIHRYESRWKTRFSACLVFQILFIANYLKQVIGKILCLEKCLGSWSPPMLHTGGFFRGFLVIVEMGPNKCLSLTSQFTEHLHVFLVSAFLL